MSSPGCIVPVTCVHVQMSRWILDNVTGTEASSCAPIIDDGAIRDHLREIRRIMSSEDLANATRNARLLRAEKSKGRRLRTY